MAGTMLDNIFLSTPSARRATETKLATAQAKVISIHALREEGDQRYTRSSPYGCVFLSTPSARRATPDGRRPERPRQYFYPRPPRGGRPLTRFRLSLPTDFYPRPPRGGRHGVAATWGALIQFLSTPSARRATGQSKTRQTTCLNFYPRPPRGGRPFLPFAVQRIDKFLSTPSARRATCRDQYDELQRLFLSTPSARRATAKTETKSLFSNKLYNILHEFRRALIYNGSKNYPNHAKRLKNPVRRCRKNAENSPFAPRRETQNNSRPSCSKGG